jgi:hypothetical protein
MWYTFHLQGKFLKAKLLGSKGVSSQALCLRPVILATQEAEIRRIAVQSQPRQIVCELLSQKTLPQNRAEWWSGSK